jgi:hypothetical protein
MKELKDRIEGEIEDIHAIPELPHIRFAVNETPYCFWDLDVHGKNLEFIIKIDPKYFEHVADLHGELLEGDEKQYAAAALRIAYSHGLETLFALLCAVVQAPDCVIGWFLKYQNRDLYELVRKIRERRFVYSKLHRHPVTWRVIADVIFTNFKTGDETKDENIRRNFGRLWGRFASDFLELKNDAEYNSIKHGLRARMGGFSLAMGLEDVPGVPAPPERMETVAQSIFGSSFFVPERLHDNRNFTVSHQSLNWDPENLIYALRLISTSIHNAVASLRVLHGVPLNKVPFAWSDNDETYDLPWLRYSGMTSIAWNSQITEQAITPASKEEILAVYSEGRNEGID